MVKKIRLKSKLGKRYINMLGGGTESIFQSHTIPKKEKLKKYSVHKNAFQIIFQ